MPTFTEPKIVAGGSATIAGNSSTATRMFQLSTTGEVAEEWDVALAPGIPREGQPHPQAGNLRVTSVAPRRMPNSHNHWQVAVTYAVPAGVSTSGGEDATNPLAEPAQVSWGSQTVDIVVSEDERGNPIEDTAGYPIIGLTTTESLPVLTIVRNQASFNFGRIDDLVGSVNRSGITIASAPIQARKGMITEYGGERIVTPGLTYWRVRYQFMINPRRWDKRIAMVGWRNKDDELYQDPVTQQYATEPTRLDRDGNFTTNSAYVKTFYLKREETWSFSPSLTRV